MPVVEYIELGAARADLIARLARRTAGFDALLLPTVTLTAPPIAAFARVDDYRPLNAAILPNPSAINFHHRVAATTPRQTPGSPPGGPMHGGEHGAQRLLPRTASSV